MNTDKVDARFEYMRTVQVCVGDIVCNTLFSQNPIADSAAHKLLAHKAEMRLYEHLFTQPEGYKLLRSTTHEERSFPEDATSDNGSYYNTCCECGRQFTGHKRRIVCKVCTNEKPMIAAAQEGK